MYMPLLMNVGACLTAPPPFLRRPIASYIDPPAEMQLTHDADEVQSIVAIACYCDWSNKRVHIMRAAQGILAWRSQGGRAAGVPFHVFEALQAIDTRCQKIGVL